MDFKDYYSTLGVPKTASAKDLKAAYRKLARKHHPDVNQGDKSAEARFKEINEAYEVLGDPEKRKKYDELGANWRQYRAGGRGRPAVFGGQPGGAWNVNVGGQPGGFRTMSPEEMREMFGDGDPFSDFFHTFFGGSPGGGSDDRTGRGRGGRARARKGRDVEQEIELGLEDAYRGSTRRFSLVQRRARAHGGRADSGGRRRRLACPRRRRRRTGIGRGGVGRSVPAHPHGAAPGVRAQGPRPLHARHDSAHDGRARRRGRGQARSAANRCG